MSTIRSVKGANTWIPSPLYGKTTTQAPALAGCGASAKPCVTCKYKCHSFRIMWLDGQSMSIMLEAYSSPHAIGPEHLAVIDPH